jgi:predicted DNA-binding transcriptional regulator YafY
MIDITTKIPKGHKNAKTDIELAGELNIPKRQIRRLISEARRTNIILNMQDGKGYFIPTQKEKELCKDWLMQEESRLKRHALSLRAVRKFIKEG